MTRVGLRVARTIAAGATVVLLTPLTSRAFDDSYPVRLALIGSLAVVAIAVLDPARRLWVRAAMQVTGVLVVTAAAVSSAGGDLPVDLGRALTTGLDEALSARWPAPPTPVAVGAVVALVAVAAAVASELGRDGRIGAGVLVPGVVVLVAIALLGAPSGAPAAIVLGVWAVTAVVTLALLQASRNVRSTGLVTLGGWLDLAGVAVLALVALVVPLLTTAALAGADRYDPRDRRHEETEVLETVSPLDLVADERELRPSEVLFEVSTLEFPRWRRVALTRYDGRSWMPADDFRAAGRELGETEGAIDVELQVVGLDGQWVPVVDDVVRTSVAVRTDAEVGSLLAVDELAPEQRIVLGVRPVVPPDQAPSSFTALDRPSPFTAGVELPAELAELAIEATSGANNPYDRALRLAEYIRRSYRLDAETPAGETLGQLTAFLTLTKRGNAEQFVAAYALLAGALGLPVRISVGWEVPTSAATPVPVRTSEATAWPEVGFEQAGWVAFDPVPDVSEPPPPSSEEVVAPVAPVPPPAVEPEGPSVAETEDDQTDDVVAAGGTSGRPWLWLLLLLVPVLLVGGYVAIVLGLKRRRWHASRRRRSPAQSVTGAFLRACEMVVDLGGDFDPTRTDLDNGRRAAATVGEPGGVLVRLAGRSTKAVYAPISPTRGEEERAWEELEEFEGRLRSTVSRRRWWRARLSLRSLRRRPIT